MGGHKCYENHHTYLTPVLKCMKTFYMLDDACLAQLHWHCGVYIQGRIVTRKGDNSKLDIFKFGISCGTDCLYTGNCKKSKFSLIFELGGLLLVVTLAIFVRKQGSELVFQRNMPDWPHKPVSTFKLIMSFFCRMTVNPWITLLSQCYTATVKTDGSIKALRSLCHLTLGSGLTANIHGKLSIFSCKYLLIMTWLDLVQMLSSKSDGVVPICHQRS